jgi:large subunit ribosomal protein L7/L12
MFVPLWLIGLTFALFAVLAARAFRRGGGGDMIERQQRAARRIGAPTPHRSGEASHLPQSLRSDEAAVLAVPEVRTALERGRKIEAIRLVREHTGLGLKEAKDLVERLPQR